MLRDENYDGSSKQADIYAFSIIVHEIVHREGPFNINTMHSVSIDWIIEQVKQIPRANLNLEELFRPKIKVVNCVSSYFQMISVKWLTFDFLVTKKCLCRMMSV